MKNNRKNFSKSFLMIFFLIALILSVFTIPVFAQINDNPPGSIESPYPQNFNLVSFINFVLEKIVLPIGSAIAVLFLVYAGFLFVTARGSEDKINTAKKTLLWTVIGIAILLGAVVISTGIKETICQISNVPGLCGS